MCEVTLRDLIHRINVEAAEAAVIDRELLKWATPNEHGDTPLRLALRAFGGKSLRQTANALGVSPTYLSRRHSRLEHAGRREQQNFERPG